MAPPNRLFSSPFIKLAAYYVLLGAVMWGLVTLFPAIQDAFSMNQLRSLAGTDIFQPEVTVTGAGGDQTMFRTPVDAALAATFAMFGALALLLPVAWVYMLTKQEKGYDESVVHTVIILPIPVTGLVIVVQNSLALAFSLAGIVAAVRFRSTLDDTKDAVYIFLAIGTALAAGAQALGIAAATSVIFNYLVLVMWKFKIGNIYADQLKRIPKMRLGDVLAGAGSTPGAGSGNLTIGDPGMLAALTPDSLGGIAERKAKLREHIESSGKRKYDGLLVVLAKGTEECMNVIDDVLRERTQHFKLAEISPTMDGNSSLEYLLVMKQDIPGTMLISIMRERAKDHIVAAEFRRLKVRKSKAQELHWTLPR